MSAGRAVYLTLQHGLQAVLSGYGLRHSYVAITNLQKYEATTKKLAEWSQEAQDQLNKTRTTQSAGAVAVGIRFQDPEITADHPSDTPLFRDSHRIAISIGLPSILDQAGSVNCHAGDCSRRTALHQGFLGTGNGR